ncbi:protein of unknown function [Cupriavidus taiwanensis]|nr:protein of unknown function [Cupriavidus taiwanensis]
MQTDSSTSATYTGTFGNNSMYYISPTGQSKRFLAGPTGCEITGIAYTPDLTTCFITSSTPPASGRTRPSRRARPPSCAPCRRQADRVPDRAVQ